LSPLDTVYSVDAFGVIVVISTCTVGVATCDVFASLHCSTGDEGLDLLSTQLRAFKQQQQVDDDAMATARPPLPLLCAAG